MYPNLGTHHQHRARHHRKFSTVYRSKGPFFKTYSTNFVNIIVHIKNSTLQFNFAIQLCNNLQIINKNYCLRMCGYNFK